MKRIFGFVEASFNIIYLLIASVIAILLLVLPGFSSARLLAAIMALILVFGDSFHLVPRIRAVFLGEAKTNNQALGIGKQLTSITMTIFYLLLWYLGLLAFNSQNMLFWTISLFVLSSTRIFLCLLPQNKWANPHPPTSWGIYRNIPFVMIGVIVAILFFVNRALVYALQLVWIAILLSFIFYIPVVLFANKTPKIGMLMLPKTMAYIWLLFMFLFL